MILENLKTLNVLVTGASGFIGSNLIQKLLDLGANIRGITHNKEPPKRHKLVDYIKADLRVTADCEKACKDMDYVFMCAANSSGASVIENDPLAHLTPNLIMNAQMLSAAYLSGVEKFIFISSNTVYPVSEESMKESSVDFTFFEKYYIVGWMKMFSEVMTSMYSERIKKKMGTLIVRPGNIYGPYDKYQWEESKVVAALVRRFAEKQNPLEVWGDGKDIKDFIYVDDFIDGLLEAAFTKGLTGPINIASGKDVTINNVIEYLMEITGEKKEINYKLGMPSMIPIRRIDTNYAFDTLGWKTKTSLKEGLSKTLKWYKNFYKC
jgi:GDP-L-fucose synthase